MRQWRRRRASASANHLFPSISTEVAGRHRLVDQPPILFHTRQAGARADVSRGDWKPIACRCPTIVRVLFDRYHLEDWALKVVGIGSVGTRCLIVLFFSPEGHPLLLQFKEARRSVLAPYAGKSVYENQGQRVVMGQRLMQSASDIFLGWARGRRGRDFFVRQLRDMKFSFPVEGMSPVILQRYAEVCGWTLARAHAKSGDAATISGYLGKSDAFDQAIGDFALAYADQNERDHAALVAAVRMKAITVEPHQPGPARLEDVPEPDLRDGPVLVEAIAVGVCGTDVEIVEGKYGWAPPGKTRLVLGHESLGRVIDPGPSGALRPAISSSASSAVPTRCRARTARSASGTCAGTASTPSAASRRSTASCRSAGGSSRSTP